MNYPDAVIVTPRTDNNDTIEINSQDLVENMEDIFDNNGNDGEYILYIREEGNFKDRGLYLGDVKYLDYDFRLVVDNQGGLILLPVKRNE